MSKQVTHLDVGVTMSMAHLLGTKPTIEILCGRTDGGYIHDSDTEIRRTGKYAAACNCPDCQTIASLMYRSDSKPATARRKYRRLQNGR
jgi:hypothetical protein